MQGPRVTFSLLDPAPAAPVSAVTNVLFMTDRTRPPACASGHEVSTPSFLPGPALAPTPAWPVPDTAVLFWGWEGGGNPAYL